MAQSDSEKLRLQPFGRLAVRALTRWYMDTSAAVKLLINESESDALASSIDSTGPDLVACWLLETELRRVANRVPELTQDLVSDFLRNLDLYEVPRTLFHEAGLLPGTDLRSLDALHLAAAIRLDVDQVITYDDRMRTSAHSLGLTVAAPS